MTHLALPPIENRGLQVGRSTQKVSVAVSPAEGGGFKWTGVAAARIGLGGVWRGRVC